MNEHLKAEDWFREAQASIHQGVNQPLEVRVGLLMQATSQMATGLEKLAQQMKELERRLPLAQR